MTAAVMEAASWPHRVVPGAANGAVILALHGTGADESDLLPLAELVAPGQPVLSPRGPVKEGHANRWFRRFAEGRFDLADVGQRAGELTAWLDAAKAEYGLAGRKVMALGFSNGANIAAALLLRHPRTLAGAVLLRGQATLDAAGSTAAGMPVLLVSGAMDPIVPARESARLAEALSAAGAVLDHRVVPASHGLTQQDVALANSFLA